MSALASLIGLPPSRRELMGRLGTVSLEAAGHQRDAAAAMRAAAATDAELRQTRNQRDQAIRERDAERNRAALLEEQLAAAVADRDHDRLTGLRNRCWLEAEWPGLDPAGLLLLDLDGFKAVNDMFGHAAGDEVLVEVARRLPGHEGCAPVRLHGDEFVIVLGAGRPVGPTAAMVGGLIGGVPVRMTGGAMVVVSATVGAVEVEPGEALASALRRADAAMYTAKPARRPPLPGPAASPTGCAGRRRYRDAERGVA
jgi:diguanylate cyclase (GGDEF)-like protein